VHAASPYGLMICCRRSHPPLPVAADSRSEHPCFNGATFIAPLHSERLFP
jgi:hypothetical protein